MLNILYSEAVYSDPALEAEAFGPEVNIIRYDAASLDSIPDEVCRDIDGLMLFRHFMPAETMARFPRLRAIVRMGVGFDRIDRHAAAARGIIVSNCPDYATGEVADHAISMALALRKGLLLHYQSQRGCAVTPWTPIQHPALRRMASQTVGVVGLGRIGIAVAMRAKAFGCRVVFHDPYVANGLETALGLERAGNLDALLRQADILSLHTPLTGETRGMIGAAELASLRPGALVINTARGPIIDLTALTAALRDGHIAGAGLDVLPTEPPVLPLPDLLQAYQAQEPWIAGRLIITPHAAFVTPEAYQDVKRKSAETMIAALKTDQPRNVVTLEME